MSTQNALELATTALHAAIAVTDNSGLRKQCIDAMRALSEEVSIRSEVDTLTSTLDKLRVPRIQGNDYRTLNDRVNWLLDRKEPVATVESAVAGCKGFHAKLTAGAVMPAVGTPLHVVSCQTELPELTSRIVNDMCWEVVKQLPEMLSPVNFNAFKPAMYEGLKLYHEQLKERENNAPS